MSSITTPNTSTRYEVEMLDNWKGVIDPQKRRTLQNRLNQRAHRRRKKTAQAQRTIPKNAPIRPMEKETSSAVSLPSSTPLNSSKGTPTTQSTPQITLTLPSLLYTLNTLRILGPSAPHSQQTLTHLEHLLSKHLQSTPSPTTDLLLPLTRVNVLRALHTNIAILGYTATEMHDAAVSPFATIGPVKPCLRNTEDPSFPASLRPTPTQLCTPHHPWLDLLPIPNMRDTLIRAESALGNAFDDIALCRAMCGHGTLSPPDPGGVKGDIGRGETGIIIWRDPWDPAGWEVTETFVRRWGWVVRGCTELFRSTDWWRGVRGERALFRGS
ncbi:bZIP transcription factor [Aspergillus mulundensis]|uniref:BZIP domain-containing protein n=1 Tax=Aspergillus mulundensis TaxID=1810919 RepID=A0A3D8QHK5_9EURO|nr:hypothetical protein DSM5745_10648 [Aspergillus mulundensis]RDW61150.1 hypothetical protein DSM5745_10648 [Aspergillus mulundensis]